MREAEDQIDAARDIIEQLVTDGFDRAELPGPGDIAEAIRDAGYTLYEEDTP